MEVAAGSYATSGTLANTGIKGWLAGLGILLLAGGVALTMVTSRRRRT